MAPGFNEGYRIVRGYTDLSDSTGESDGFVTADGLVWKKIERTPVTLATGEQLWHRYGTEGDCSSNLWVWPTTFKEFTITFEPVPDLKPLPAYDQVRESVIALPKKEQAQLYRWMYDALGCRR